MTSIKFSLEKEVRRSAYDATKEEALTFEKLKQLAIKLFPALESKEFQVCYRDDENDLVTFSSDDELTEAIKFMLPKSTTLKFTIQLPNSGTNESNDPSKSKGGKVKKGGVVLPVSLSPQEVVAASALLNHNEDSDSSVSLTNGTRVPKRSRGQLEEGNGEATLTSTLPDGENPTKRRQCYTVSEKIALINEYNAYSTTNKKPMKQFALENNINQKTFSSWMKEYQDGKLTNLTQVTDNKRIRLRKAEYPEIESLLIQFIESYDPNQTVSWSLIRTYALKYAKDVLPAEEYSNFKASDGWIQNFLKRNNIILHRRMKVINPAVGAVTATSVATAATTVTATATAAASVVVNVTNDQSSDDSSAQSS